MIISSLLSASMNKSKDDAPSDKPAEQPSFLWSAVTSFVGLAIMIGAVVIATRCNPNEKWGYGILAFLFPEIYLIQWGIRKYIVKEATYCPL
jgi:hypothetical protein